MKHVAEERVATEVNPVEARPASCSKPNDGLAFVWFEYGMGWVTDVVKNT